MLRLIGGLNRIYRVLQSPRRITCAGLLRAKSSDRGPEGTYQSRCAAEGLPQAGGSSAGMGTVGVGGMNSAGEIAFGAPNRGLPQRLRLRQ